MLQLQYRYCHSRQHWGKPTAHDVHNVRPSHAEAGKCDVVGVDILPRRPIYCQERQVSHCDRVDEPSFFVQLDRFSPTDCGVAAAGTTCPTSLTTRKAFRGGTPHARVDGERHRCGDWWKLVRGMESWGMVSCHSTKQGIRC